jgi:hypothetical protein
MKPLAIKRTPRKFVNHAAWHVVGGRRIYFRSKWEYSYALYLHWQKEQKIILEWEYEPKTFWFENIKRGVRSYKPDFRVQRSPGSTIWIEVKGYLDPKSKTKLARFKKYYPNEQIEVVGKAWFERRSFVVGR